MRASTVLSVLALGLAACGGGGGSGDDAPGADGGAGSDGGGGPDGGGDRGPHPFGTHGGYHAGGVIFPGGSQVDLDDATAAAYDRWKARYLEPACVAGQYRIKTTPATDAYTVSEGHGYGMLLTVIMAGHDPDARVELDGLYAYYAAHPSDGDPALMAWAQDAQCHDVDGVDSATDGDLDIAYALLLADRQWGSDGAVDYRAAATRIIAAILASEIHPANSILVGDWANDAGDAHYTGTRPSDFTVGHFRAFAAATGVARWTAVADKTYAVIDALQTGFAPATGLLPDFAVGATGAAPAPAPAGWLEGPDDGAYAWNACRTPWRIATDYLMAGEPRARDAVRPITAWIRGVTGDDPGAVVDGYRLSGQAIGSGPELAFVAPLAVAAMVEPATGTNQPWLDALWTFLVDAAPGDYYGDSLAVLAMVVVSGNWWAP
ncbi:MAG: hypothetical protein H6709_09695 [Kofleriaceae bacterium]|nr:chitosanase [Myxococcales bacterium]MCB9565544.1 hypothetical protein [Kofleriaceae bacterium]MCB9572345.1 hypothetical protein [Kofleriaceae bacterium]